MPMVRLVLSKEFCRVQGFALIIPKDAPIPPMMNQSSEEEKHTQSALLHPDLAHRWLQRLSIRPQSY